MKLTWKGGAVVGAKAETAADVGELTQLVLAHGVDGALNRLGAQVAQRELRRQYGDQSQPAAAHRLPTPGAQGNADRRVEAARTSPGTTAPKEKPL